jgi:CMP-N-acetylneuraminic acid synthetase
MTVVGLIPARAGSKRLPGKNIIPLVGRPLIAHTCEVAREAADVLDAVYVNTDSPHIAGIAEQHGVPCPVLRPEHLAADDTTTRDSNLFLLDFLARRGERYDAIMSIQPTSPLRTADDIRAAWQLFLTHAPCEVVSVTPLVPRWWTGSVMADGRFDRFVGEDLVYRLNGAIYVHGCDDYFSGRPARNTIAYQMPLERSVDIDTRADLEYAEFLMQRLRQGVAT